MQQFKQCTAEGCARNSHRSMNGKLGYCSMHYQRFKRTGDPLKTRPIPSPALDCIEANKNYSGDQCLIWPFHIGKDGYGRVHHPETYHLTTASRLICIAAHGEPPSPQHEAAHTCGNGNKGCFSPKHLYWATSARNHADKILHGTSNRGTNQGSSRLTENDILTIRHFSQNQRQMDIAKKFGVSPSHIAHIKAGHAWGWLKEYCVWPRQP